MIASARSVTIVIFLGVVRVRLKYTRILIVLVLDIFISLFDHGDLFKDSFDLKIYPCFRFTLSLSKKDEELRVLREQLRDKTVRYFTYCFQQIEVREYTAACQL